MAQILDIDELIIEPLNSTHQVRKFSCGNNDIDVYLRAHAKKNTLYGHGKTYVAVQPGQRRPWGYFSVSASTIDADNLPTTDGCPKKISVVLLGRVGADIALKGSGLGVKLVTHAMERSIAASEIIGVHSIVLTAKEDWLIEYYGRFGFVSLMDDPKHMYMPIDVAIDALKDE